MMDFRYLEVCLNDGQIPDKPLGLDISDTRTDHPDTADQSWCREVSGSTNQAAVAPKVVRNITTRSLVKAHEEPDPGEQADETKSSTSEERPMSIRLKSKICLGTSQYSWQAARL